MLLVNTHLALPGRRGKYDYANWTVEVQGDLTQVKASGPPLFQRSLKKRNQCVQFSHASRMRMLKMVAKIDWFGCDPAVFITLTYPDTSLWCTYKERSKHRFLFHRKVEEWCGKQVPCIWRVEWKPRRSGLFKGFGVPHLHLIVPTITYLPWRLVRKWWREVLHVEGVLKTWITRIDGAHGAAKYICKYMAKVPSLVSTAYHNSRVTIGRSWGVLRTRQIPRHPVRLYRPLSPVEIDFIKGLRKHLPNTKPFWREVGFTIFGRDVADQVVEILQRPLADGEILD